MEMERSKSEPEGSKRNARSQCPEPVEGLCLRCVVAFRMLPQHLVNDFDRPFRALFFFFANDFR